MSKNKIPHLPPHLTSALPEIIPTLCSPLNEFQTQRQQNHHCEDEQK
jgi:hypothetical protein